MKLFEVPMSTMHNPLLKLVATKIKSALNETYPDYEISEQQIYGQITTPPNLKLGQFAFPCFMMAKELKKGPPQISAQLKEKIATDEFITEVNPAGPYLNFKISSKAFGEFILKEIISENFFTQEITDVKPKTMIEYSQPNTHKEMHVGHMRNLCLGNALVRIKRYCNQDVLATTYPGDSGTHVAKCLWYLKNHNKGAIPTEEKGAWLGRIYSTANLLLEDQLGTEKEEQNRKELTEILRQLEAESGEFYDLWVETRKWSIDLMNEAYDWADVQFDRWFFESEVDRPSLKTVKDLYNKGLLVEDQGAIGMDLSDDKLGFCILIKSDGNGLYATKDVELAIKKFKDFGIEKNIYIVDERQSFHFKQVFKVLEKIGFPQAKDCHHLPYDVVELPDGPMSSRKGNIVPLMELIHKMEATIKNNYLEKYRGDWTDAEIEETAKIVANGAIKYGMVRVDNIRKIIFDMNEWLKLDGDTGPYLQYVHARIQSLIAKSGIELDASIEWNKLEKEQEQALLLKLHAFNEVVLRAHELNKTILLTGYLFELGKLYNSFYAECPINKESDEELKKARLALSLSVAKTMKVGLSLLGITAPQKM